MKVKAILLALLLLCLQGSASLIPTPGRPCRRQHYRSPPEGSMFSATALGTVEMRRKDFSELLRVQWAKASLLPIPLVEEGSEWEMM